MYRKSIYIGLKFISYCNAFPKIIFPKNCKTIENHCELSVQSTINTNKSGSSELRFPLSVLYQFLLKAYIFCFLVYLLLSILCVHIFETARRLIK